MARKSVANVCRRAAACIAWLDLAIEDEQVVLTVRGGGRGFRPVAPNVLPRTGHFGLAGMRERLQHIGGRLVVTSPPAPARPAGCPPHLAGAQPIAQEQEC